MIKKKKLTWKNRLAANPQQLRGIPAKTWIWMKIYITPGTNLAQDVYEIFLKCSLFTNQVIHLCEILKTFMCLVDSYYYYLSLVKHQVLRAVQATHVSSQSLLPRRFNGGAWSKVQGSFFLNQAVADDKIPKEIEEGIKALRIFFFFPLGCLFASYISSEYPLDQSSLQGILIMK